MSCAKSVYTVNATPIYKRGDRLKIVIILLKFIKLYISVYIPFISMVSLNLCLYS